ncbi:hypothetical protein [Nocardioides sp.]|uniref:hypothetical protein n=1 Tax=Nocardioides sp. TaxID=35761 RepID=UPI003513FDC9
MSGEGRAWAWAAALREGTTTGWREWSEREAPEVPEQRGQRGHRLPGAQQMSVLLRLNRLAEATGRRVDQATADRVLAADLAGRGRSELALTGLEARDYGPRPVDPDELGADELLRVVTSLLADDVARRARIPDPPRRSSRAGAQAAHAAQAAIVARLDRARRARSRSAGFVVVGVPWRVPAVEATLRARGLQPGGRAPVAYLLAEDLGTSLAHAWTSRSFDQGGHGWPGFVRAAATGGRIPPRADLARMARAARERWGAEQVRVVLDVAALADELGVPEIVEPAPLGADAIELVRRVGEPLGLLGDERLRPGLLRSVLASRLAGRGGALPTVEPRWTPWLRSHAERVRHELTAAGYGVLGDLDALVPAAVPSTPVLPSADGALALGLELLLDPDLCSAPRAEARA